jgi:uncharacterized coiled-coil DUF342 family protein
VIDRAWAALHNARLAATRAVRRLADPQCDDDARDLWEARLVLGRALAGLGIEAPVTCAERARALVAARGELAKTLAEARSYSRSVERERRDAQDEAKEEREERAHYQAEAERLMSMVTDLEEGQAKMRDLGSEVERLKAELAIAREDLQRHARGNR